MAKMTVAQAVVEILRQQAVPFVAGIPGNGVMDYLDAMHGQPDLRFILVRHEQVAAYMALGHAQACGRPAVTLVTKGPGAAHTVVGVAAAFAEGSPLIAISAQVESHAIGLGANQSIELEALFKPITKWSVQATHPARVPEIVEEAFRVATTGRPGPVHIAIPANFATAEVDFRPAPKTAFVRPARLPADDEAIRQVADLLLRAERPAVIAGGGVTRAGAAGELLELVERLTAAAVNPWLKKTLPEAHPLVLGSIGRGGSHAAARALAEADVVLVAGSRLGEAATDSYRMKFDGRAQVIQIDIDPGTVGRVLRVDVGIQADLKAALEQILRIVREQRPERCGRPDRLRAIAGLWDEWQRELDAVDYAARPIATPRLIRELRAVTDPDALVAFDAGNFNLWTTRYFTTQVSNGVIFPAANGPMGHALPGAMGAKLAFPGRQVVAVAGDGGFIMTMGDLETALREGIKVTAVVVNNMGLGLIRMRQQAKYGGRLIGCRLGNPDFARVAEDFGCHGERVEDPDEIGPALRRALAADRPAVVDVLVDPNEVCTAGVERWWTMDERAVGSRQ